VVPAILFGVSEFDAAARRGGWAGLSRVASIMRGRDAERSSGNWRKRRSDVSTFRDAPPNGERKSVNLRLEIRLHACRVDPIAAGKTGKEERNEEEGERERMARDEAMIRNAVFLEAVTLSEIETPRGRGSRA